MEKNLRASRNEDFEDEILESHSNQLQLLLFLNCVIFQAGSPQCTAPPQCGLRLRGSAGDVEMPQRESLSPFESSGSREMGNQVDFTSLFAKSVDSKPVLMLQMILLAPRWTPEFK